MSPDAAALSQPPHSGTRQDADAESFGFEKGDLAQLVTPPRFDSLDDERQYLKERIALACRIFAQYGLDHHIVSGDPSGYSVRGTRWVRRQGAGRMRVSSLKMVETFGGHGGRWSGPGSLGAAVTDPCFFPTGWTSYRPRTRRA